MGLARGVFCLCGGDGTGTKKLTPVPAAHSPAGAGPDRSSAGPADHSSPDHSLAAGLGAGLDVDPARTTVGRMAVAAGPGPGPGPGPGRSFVGRRVAVLGAGPGLDRIVAGCRGRTLLVVFDGEQGV